MPVAEQFFNSLSTEAHLQALADEKREEDLHLEFKTKNNSEEWKLDEGDKRHFSRTLSAFANADGGVLIFGIKTSKADGPDRAHSLKSIADHLRFKACLADSILTTTQPVVEGVRIEAIDSASAGRGYVKCLVPQSFRPPHRAMKAENQYLCRTSNGNRIMEHFELEDVFGRRMRPVLTFDVELLQHPSEPKYRVLTFRCKNAGRAMAKYVGFHCNIKGARIVDLEHLRSDSGIDDGQQIVAYFNDRAVVPPNGPNSQFGRVTLALDDDAAPVLLGILWYAENMETRQAATSLLTSDRKLLS